MIEISRLHNLALKSDSDSTALLLGRAEISSTVEPRLTVTSFKTDTRDGDLVITATFFVPAKRPYIFLWQNLLMRPPC